MEILPQHTHNNETSEQHTSTEVTSRQQKDSRRRIETENELCPLSTKTGNNFSVMVKNYIPFGLSSSFITQGSVLGSLRPLRALLNQSEHIASLSQPHWSELISILLQCSLEMSSSSWAVRMLRVLLNLLWSDRGDPSPPCPLCCFATEIYSFIVLEAKNLKSERQQGHPPSGGFILPAVSGSSPYPLDGMGAMVCQKLGPKTDLSDRHNI